MTLGCKAEWQFGRLKEGELFHFLKRQSVSIICKYVLIENIEFDCGLNPYM